MAHRILGIDIGNTEVKAILADVSWREASVVGMYTETVPDLAEIEHRLLPGDAEEPAARDGEAGAESPADENAVSRAPAPPWVYALANLIKKHGLEFNEVHCALPGARSTARILTLPFNNRRRLEQVLPFELENVVPFDLDTMHWAFDILGKNPEGGFRVLVALTPKPEMEAFIFNLSRAGVDPKIVDLAPYTLFAAARMNLAPEMGAYGILDLGAGHADMAVVNEGSLVDLRSLPFGSARLDEALAKVLNLDVERARVVKETKADLGAADRVGDALREAMQPFFVRLRQTIQGIRSTAGIEITRLYLTGRGSLLAGLDRLLTDEFGLEIERLQSVPRDLPLISTDPDNPADQARYGLAMALAHHGQNALRGIDLNLRHGSFFYRRQTLAVKSSLRQVAVLGVILVLLLAYNIVAGYLQKSRQLEALQDQVVQVYMKSFPGSVPPVRPLDQFRGQISKTMAKYKTVGFLGDENLRAIDIWKAMSQLIPPTVTIDIKKFDLTEDALKIEGEVGAFSDVDKIEEALKKFPGFKQVKKESSATVSEKVKFKFHISLSEKGAKKSTARGGAAAPATTAGAES